MDKIFCEFCCQEINKEKARPCEYCQLEGLGNCCIDPMDHGCTDDPSDCLDCDTYWEEMREKGYWDDEKGWTEKGMREVGKI